MCGKEIPTTLRPKNWFGLHGIDENLSEVSGCEGFEGITAAYFGIEFARDVELQSSKFRTTQENIIDWIYKNWTVNIETKREVTRPVCVVNTGVHDQGIAGITTAGYMANIRWYFRLLDPACVHIVWLHSTAPASDNFPQHTDSLRKWNNEVANFLLNDDVLREKSSVVDIFETSISWPHDDNVHMKVDWYYSLGGMF